MKHLIMIISIILIMFGCSMTGTGPQEQYPDDEKKTALVIECYQTLEMEVQYDTLKKMYPLAMIDYWIDGKFEDSLARAHQTAFTRDSLIDSEMVVLVSEVPNRQPVSGVKGGKRLIFTGNNSPCRFALTNYDSNDSTAISVKSTSDSPTVELSIEEKTVLLLEGDSLVQTDTVLARTDSTYCWQLLIIRRVIQNHGYCSLPNERYLYYFYHWLPIDIYSY